MITVQQSNPYKSNHKPTFGNSDGPSPLIHTDYNFSLVGARYTRGQFTNIRPNAEIVSEFRGPRASSNKYWGNFRKAVIDNCKPVDRNIYESTSNPRIEEAIAKLGKKFNIVFKVKI